MHSTDDEVEFLAVGPPTNCGQPLKGSTKSFLCVRCGMAFSGARTFSHHQLVECCMRSPSQVLHACAVTNISKLSGLDVLHVFALEKQAGVPLSLSHSHQLKHRSVDSPDDLPSSRSSQFSGAEDSLQSRLESVGRQTSLSQISEYLIEKLLNEAATFHSTADLTMSTISATGTTATAAGTASVPADGDQLTSASDSLTVPPLSLELLHVPQYQQLFDRLREEAAELVNNNNNSNNNNNNNNNNKNNNSNSNSSNNNTNNDNNDTSTSTTNNKSHQHQQSSTPTPSTSLDEQPLVDQLLQQAQKLGEQLTSCGDNNGAAVEFVDWHYCCLCDQHVDRSNVARHVHLPSDVCGFCLLQVNSPAEMMIHRRRCHQSRRRLCCPLCSLRFDIPHSYRRHALSHRLDTELLLPGEVDVSITGTQTVSEWQCELCHSAMPRGTITIRQIREHVTATCPLLSVPDQTFNMMFPYSLPMKS